MKTLLGLFCLLPWLTACGTLQVRTAPEARVNVHHNVFVEHELSDGRSIDLFIMRKLQSMGYEASAGPLTMKPVDAELVVTYQDDWTFDFTTYLIELNVQVHDARTGRELAIGRYFKPSITGDVTSDMVDPLIGRLFGGKPAPGPAP
jgi:hypothetical protein